MTFGEVCAEAIRTHLTKACLRQAQLTGKIVATLIDEAVAAHADELRAFLTPKAAPAKVRARDLVFEALAEVCEADIAQMTAHSRGSYNSAAKEIRSVCAGQDNDIIAQQIRVRASLYKRRHPTWPFTVSTLAKYWPELHADATIIKLPVAPVPAEWVDVFLKLNPSFTRVSEKAVKRGDCEYRWSTLPQNERNEINRRIEADAPKGMAALLP